jgi:hypothetical protein
VTSDIQTQLNSKLPPSQPLSGDLSGTLSKCDGRCHSTSQRVVGGAYEWTGADLEQQHQSLGAPCCFRSGRSGSLLNQLRISDDGVDPRHPAPTRNWQPARGLLRQLPTECESAAEPRHD